MNCTWMDRDVPPSLVASRLVRSVPRGKERPDVAALLAGFVNLFRGEGNIVIGLGGRPEALLPWGCLLCLSLAVLAGPEPVGSPAATTVDRTDIVQLHCTNKR